MKTSSTFLTGILLLFSFLSFSHGSTGMPRVVIGGPTNSLDFGSGLLNLSNTAGTLFNFTFDNNGIGKAYSFITGSCSITLPLNLVDFSGRLQDKAVKLNWRSMNEANVDRYELQRSTDGNHYQTIALVFAMNGQDNSYAYKDPHPHKGTNYYRLKIFDIDGKVNYSDVVSFLFNEAIPGTMIVAPNPVRESIRARLTGIEQGSYEMKLYSMDGRMVAVKSIVINRHDQVETMERGVNMRPGAYSLNLYNTNGVLINTVTLVITD